VGQLHNPRDPLVLGSQLRKARETVHLRPEDVATHLGIRPEEVREWEAERSRPDLRQLEALAEVYGREIDYFLKSTPDRPARFQFRSVRRQSLWDVSREARLVIAKFDELCRTAIELERVLGKVKHPIMSPEPRRESPAVLATEERYALRFDGKPAKQLRERLAQERGIRVFELPVPPDQFSGLSYWHQEYGPCVLVNSKETAGRKTFTLAHEYGHLLYHHQPSVCDIIDEGRREVFGDERSANIFAIEFLLPADPVRDHFLQRQLRREPSVQDIGKLAGRWLVSVQAMAYRLEELGVINRGYADELLSNYQPSVPRPRGQRAPRWQKRFGREFVSNAIEAYQQGQITLGKLARALGVDLRKAVRVSEEHKRENRHK